MHGSGKGDHVKDAYQEGVRFNVAAGRGQRVWPKKGSISHGGGACRGGHIEGLKKIAGGGLGREERPSKAEKARKQGKK